MQPLSSGKVQGCNHSNLGLNPNTVQGHFSNQFLSFKTSLLHTHTHTHTHTQGDLSLLNEAVWEYTVCLAAQAREGEREREKGREREKERGENMRK